MSTSERRIKTALISVRFSARDRDKLWQLAAQSGRTPQELLLSCVNWITPQQPSWLTWIQQRNAGLPDQAVRQLGHRIIKNLQPPTPEPPEINRKVLAELAAALDRWLQYRVLPDPVVHMEPIRRARTSRAENCVIGVRVTAQQMTQLKQQCQQLHARSVSSMLRNSALGYRVSQWQVTDGLSRSKRAGIASLINALETWRDLRPGVHLGKNPHLPLRIARCATAAERPLIDQCLVRAHALHGHLVNT